MHGLMIAGSGLAALLLILGGSLIRRYRQAPRGQHGRLNAPPPEQPAPRGRHRAE